MKSKRRAVNVDTTMVNKKIRTRNMINKMSRNKEPSEYAPGHNSPSNKPSLNTRAKSSTVGKSDFDPYIFTKADEECKSPSKKLKMTEKNSKDVSINTSDFTSMTDPILLGPCEPGTSIELRGIVWLETITGLLVINVTWRGRTYVGTLLDSSKYEFTPPFNSENLSVKSANSPSCRGNRGRKRYAPPVATYHSGPKSGTIRHSRRLSESLSYLNSNRKSSCYIDSLSLSAEHSFSGESDSDQKCSTVNKTRSVTRSLAKQTKSATNESELTSLVSDESSHLVKCCHLNCFKQFIDNTALSYHLHHCHGVFEETLKTEKTEELEPITHDSAKEESSTNGSDKTTIIPNGLKPKIEKIDHVEIIMAGQDEGDESEENVLVIVDNIPMKQENQLLELSISLPKLPSTIETQESLKNCPLTVVTDSQYSVRNQTAISTDICNSLTQITTQTNPIVRTVSATTVYIPVEVTTSPNSFAMSSNTTLSPASVTPKQCLTTHLKKLKPTKLSIQADNNMPSFQIPASSILSKKRPLVPMQVSSNQTFTTNQTRPISSPSVSTNHVIGVSRQSVFNNVTPILPATCSSNSCVQNISSSISSGLINTKRAIVTSNNLSPSGMTSLLSLKPIQPKPKSSSVLPTYSNPTTVPFINPVPIVNVPGVLPNQTSFQRQILPNPVTKIDNSNLLDDRSLHKVDVIQATKKKRRKSDKKLRLNFHECNKLKRFGLNPIQPKHGNESISKNDASQESYKIDEENSHSPEYSDLSEANDTPAPILEKEIELKSCDCDKLVICTDYDATVNIFSRSLNSEPENYDESKDNKPPALIPAVLSTDLLNGMNNDCEFLEGPQKTIRMKPQIIKNLSKFSDHEMIPNNDDRVCAKTVNQTPMKCNNVAITSSRRSFQSLGVDRGKSPPMSVITSSSSSSSSSLYNATHSVSANNHILKGKMSGKCSNLSAINDYVWRTKHNSDGRSIVSSKNNKGSLQLKISATEECNKNSIVAAQSKPTNGKFSVQALTSPQEIVSRSFSNSTTVISVNPNTKLASTLSRN